MADDNDHRGMGPRRPNGDRQVGTDPWGRLVTLAEHDPREIETAAPPSIEGFATLVVAGERGVTLELGSGKELHTPPDDEHLHVAEDFVERVRSTDAIEASFDTPLRFNGGATMPRARGVIEASKSHYVCARGCEWRPLAALPTGAQLFIDKEHGIGVCFVLTGDALAEVHWLNRQPRAIGDGIATMPTLRLARAKTVDGSWYIGGHPVTPELNSAPPPKSARSRR